MTRISFPSGVCHCWIKQNSGWRKRQRLYMESSTMTEDSVSDKKQYHTFQVNFLFEIPQLFCNQLSTLLISNCRCFSMVFVWQSCFQRLPATCLSRSPRLTQVWLQKTTMLAVPSGKQPLSISPGFRSKGCSANFAGQMKPRTPILHLPYSDLKSLSTLKFSIVLNYS